MLPNVRAAALTGYTEVASYHGLDAYEMLRRAHIAPDALAYPESRIPAQSLCKLLEDSARDASCDTFGLAMAECRSFASLGPITLLLEHLGNVRAIINALIEFRRHLNDIVILGIEDGDGEEIIRIELVAKYATPQSADLALGIGYTVLRGASRHRWQPHGVHFSHSAPDDRLRFERFFETRVEFGSAFNGFTCVRHSLDASWPWANETMAGHARRLLELVELMPQSAPLSDTVMRLISLLLSSGRATLSNVAARIGKSPRSLQRGLEQEGRRFAELLNEVRRSLVVQHLSAGNCSMTALAANLGFFTSSSFSRWFVAEFGVAPRTWRKEQIRAAANNVD